MSGFLSISVSVILSFSKFFLLLHGENCNLFLFRKIANKMLWNESFILSNSTKSHTTYCSRGCIESAGCNAFGYGLESSLCILYSECSDHYHLQPVSSGWNHYCLEIENRCNDGWVQFGSSCYHMVTSRLSWESARINCASMGSYLAEVTSADENNFIKSMFNAEGTDFVWLGGTDQVREDNWLWTTSNTPLNFTDWSPDQPDNYFDDDCLCMHEDKAQPERWNDCECYVDKQSICEKDIVL